MDDFGEYFFCAFLPLCLLFLFVQVFPTSSDMEEIEESSDPGSIFSRNYGHRDTIPLNVTPQPMQEVANEDLLDIELKKQGEK